jgi:hypothetical protein
MTKSKSNKYILITAKRYEFLLNIFKSKCIGEVCLSDGDNGYIVGDFSSKNKKYSKYNWDWAHKIYYTYERITSKVGNYVDYGYFEDELHENIYIFNSLNDDDLEIISKIIKEHHLLFKCNEEKSSFLQLFANATHNYYAAWERSAMKWHPFCNDYDAYLHGAQSHLLRLKSDIKLISNNQDVQNAIDEAVSNTEEFVNDKVIRDFLLSIHKSHFEVKNYEKFLND